MMLMAKNAFYKMKGYDGLVCRDISHILHKDVMALCNIDMVPNH